MTILVTGAAGFIGAHVAKTLIARGQSVVGIDNLNAYYDPALKEARLEWIGEGLDFHRLDFSDREGLAELGKTHRFDAIVHLGAQAGVRWSLDHPHDYADANLVGHLNMLELARSQKVPMVYASSSSVYGANEKVPFAETDRVDEQVSLYAATKRSCELMSQAYASLYDLPLTGLRFFTVYGPWGRPDMAAWKFVEAIEEGRALELYDADNQARDFTFIDDIVAGTIAALDRIPEEGRHRVYNLGGDRPVKLRDFLATIEQATGKSAQVVEAPAQPGDVSRTMADIARARAELDFSPTTPIEQGVKAFVDWYREYKAKGADA